MDSLKKDLFLKYIFLRRKSKCNNCITREMKQMLGINLVNCGSFRGLCVTESYTGIPVPKIYDVYVMLQKVTDFHSGICWIISRFMKLQFSNKFFF